MPWIFFHFFSQGRGRFKKKLKCICGYEIRGQYIISLETTAWMFKVYFLFVSLYLPFFFARFYKTKEEIMGRKNTRNPFYIGLSIIAKVIESMGRDNRV